MIKLNFLPSTAIVAVFYASFTLAPAGASYVCKFSYVSGQSTNTAKVDAQKRSQRAWVQETGQLHGRPWTSLAIAKDKSQQCIQQTNAWSCQTKATPCTVTK